MATDKNTNNKKKEAGNPPRFITRIRVNVLLVILLAYASILLVFFIRRISSVSKRFSPSAWHRWKSA